MPLEIVDELPDSQGRRSGWAPLPQGEVEHLQDRHRFEARPGFVLPPTRDLRPLMPPVYNQGSLNACTSNAIAAMLYCLRGEQHLPPIAPSRRFLYWYQRLAIGQQAQNVGCTVLSALNAASQHGYCPEEMFPYNDAFAVPPPPAADTVAAHHTIAPPQAPKNLAELKTALAGGFPVAMGFLYVNSFFQADLNGGHVPDPVPEPAVPHAGLIVGYSDAAQTVTLRNSWGLVRPDGHPCGDGGHYYLSYKYVCDPMFCKEFWTLPAVVDHP